jgi:hypothetical protein
MVEDTINESLKLLEIYKNNIRKELERLQNETKNEEEINQIKKCVDMINEIEEAYNSGDETKLNKIKNNAYNI